MELFNAMVSDCTISEANEAVPVEFVPFVPSKFTPGQKLTDGEIETLGRHLRTGSMLPVVGSKNPKVWIVEYDVDSGLTDELPYRYMAVRLA